MQRVDRAIGIALVVLGALVLWSARSFPNVPGQKLGAAFLPMIVGAGLAVCGIALALRRRAADAAAAEPARGSVVPALTVVGSIVFYVLAADRLGFLIVAPLVLLATFFALRVGWRAALLWAIGGTLVVHVSFYKLLRVPLPWGVLRPFY